MPVTPPQVVTIKKMSPHMPGVRWGAKSSHVENHDTRPQDLGSQSRRPPFIKMPVSIKQGPGRNIGSFLFKLFSLKTQQRRTVYRIHWVFDTWIFHKATACLLALKVKTIVGIERVGGPLSADVEETFENTILSLCAPHPHPVSPFLALVNVSLYCL